MSKCLSGSAHQGAAGDKGSELKKVANWWLALKPIYNFTQIWRVTGSKLFRKGDVGSNV